MITLSSTPGAVFRIIILYKAMSIWVHISHEWYKGFLQYGNKQRCIHFPIKDAQICSASMTDASPNMNFYWMFWLRLVPRLLSSLVAASSSVCFNLYSCFIRVNHIVKRHILIFSCPLQPLHFVHVSDHLTVACTF